MREELIGPFVACSCVLVLALQHANHCPCEAVEVVAREGSHDQCKAVCSTKKGSANASHLLLAAVVDRLTQQYIMQRAQILTEEGHFPPGQHGEAELHLVPAVLTCKRSQHGANNDACVWRDVRLSCLLRPLPHGLCDVKQAAVTSPIHA